MRRLVNREIKETGTSEDVPRTAAITQIAGEKKAPANAWHCCAVIYLGLPSPVAEFAATVGGYRADCHAATFYRVQCQLGLIGRENLLAEISESLGTPAAVSWKEVLLCRLNRGQSE